MSDERQGNYDFSTAAYFSLGLTFRPMLELYVVAPRP